MAWKMQLLPRTVSGNRGCSGKHSQVSLPAREEEGCDSAYCEVVFSALCCVHIHRGTKGFTFSLVGNVCLLFVDLQFLLS